MYNTVTFKTSKSRVTIVRRCRSMEQGQRVETQLGCKNKVQVMALGLAHIYHRATHGEMSRSSDVDDSGVFGAGHFLHSLLRSKLVFFVTVVAGLTLS